MDFKTDEIIATLKKQLDSNPLHGPEYRQRYHT